MQRLIHRVRNASVGPLSQFLDRCSPLKLNLLGLLAVLAIGYLDYVSGPELVLSAFYFVPVAISTWYAGGASGILLSCMSVATMFTVDVLAHRYEVLTIPGLNAAIRLSFFLFVVSVLRRRKVAEERIRELMRLKSEFTAMVSHELRTPLSAIKEGLAMAIESASGSLEDKPRQYLDIVGRSVDRLSRLVTNALDFQKLDAGRMEFMWEPCDVNALIASVVNAFAPMAQRQGLDLRMDLAAGLPAVICDRDKITQVVSNLLDNAIKFSGQGQVRVTTGLEDGGLRVSIRDQGTGIPNEALPKLFQQFMQLRMANRKTEGTGLGLAISKKIVDHHRGRFEVDSAVGQGSTFSFVLPLKQAAEMEI